MPAASLLTDPPPVPALTTVSFGLAVKVAVAAWSAVSVSVQVAALPLQAPLQPMNVDPGAATAVSVTLVPFANVVSQMAPQSMLAGLLVTEPLPVPALVTVSWRCSGVKVAVTEVAAVIGTVQAAVPVQAPLQPAKLEPAAGTAVSVTLVPWVTLI